MAGTSAPRAAGARRAARGLWDAIWPGRCPLCRALLEPGAPPSLCGRCLALVKPLAAPLCVVCGRELSLASMPPGQVCGHCRLEPPAFDAARSFALYDGLLAQAIRRFKFRADRSILPALQGLMQQADADWLTAHDVDAVVPVPLHRARLAARGFNQAADLAAPVARRRAVPLIRGALVRVRDTEPQYGLSMQQRRENVKGAFRVDRPKKVRGGNIMLVDDIMTTGVTLNESARALKNAGAARVVVLTLARTG
jgi:ComF family protein